MSLQINDSMHSKLRIQLKLQKVLWHSVMDLAWHEKVSLNALCHCW